MPRAGKSSSEKLVVDGWRVLAYSSGLVKVGTDNDGTFRNFTFRMTTYDDCESVADAVRQEILHRNATARPTPFIGPLFIDTGAVLSVSCRTYVDLVDLVFVLACMQMRIHATRQWMMACCKPV